MTPRNMKLLFPVCVALALGCGPLEEGEGELALDADEQAVATATHRLGTYVRTTTLLNLRSAAGTHGAILRTMPADASVFVKAGPVNTSWYQISYAGTVGYAHGAYLKTGSAEIVHKLPTTQKVVALTFDAGADRGYTAMILDTLLKEGVKASFGLTGKWSDANPDLVKRIVNEGHMVFNHTYAHDSMTGFSTNKGPMTYAARASELWKTHAAILRISGASTKPYFRPPYGDFDASVMSDISSRGYDFNFMWSLDSLGWKGLTAEQITQRVMNAAQPGAIYLFHVGAQSQDGPALPAMIQQLRAQGYGFATLSDYYVSAVPLSPRLSYVEGGVVRGPKTAKRMSLIFTGGHHAEGAAPILDALAQRGLKASFFLTGAFVKLYPALVDRMVKEGHYVGPHSDAHLLYAPWEDRSKTLVTKTQFLTDLDKNLLALSKHGPTVASMRYWVPPYERYNAQISQWSNERDMVLLTYTPGSGSEYDWRPTSHPNFVSSKSIYDGILAYENSQPEGLNGFQMMLHLGTGAHRADKFHPYVPALLDVLVGRGYSLERIDQLLRD